MKHQYTLRNKLHLSWFLSEIELTLEERCKHSEKIFCAVCTPIISSIETEPYQWIKDIDHNAI